jgi:hypothetical protein
MPASKKTRYNARAHNDPEYEQRMSNALDGYKSGKYRSIKQAAEAEQVRLLYDAHLSSYNLVQSILGS